MKVDPNMNDGSVIVTMSDGFAVRWPRLASAPNITQKDIQNLTSGLFDLIKNLDERLAAAESKR